LNFQIDNIPSIYYNIFYTPGLVADKFEWQPFRGGIFPVF